MNGVDLNIPVNILSQNKHAKREKKLSKYQKGITLWERKVLKMEEEEEIKI